MQHKTSQLGTFTTNRSAQCPKQNKSHDGFTVCIQQAIESFIQILVTSILHSGFKVNTIVNNLCRVLNINLHLYNSFRFVSQGFYNLSTKQNNVSTPQIELRSIYSLPVRIPITPQFLLELTHGVYFSMFNEFYTLAFQALNDIAARASYEGYADVLLVTGAVFNSLQANPSGFYN